MKKTTINIPTREGLAQVSGYVVRATLRDLDVGACPVRFLVHPVYEPGGQDPQAPITEITHIPSGQTVGRGAYLDGWAYLAATLGTGKRYSHKQVVEAQLGLLARQHGMATVMRKMRNAPIINPEG